VLLATNLKPVVAVFGVVLNFDNYDVQPPSVRFVNPLTRDALKLSEIAQFFPALVPAGGAEPTPGPMAVQGLVQGFTEDRPFLCLQGVREYHENPAHSGDSWFLYRKSGAGTLAQILEVIAKHGAESIRAFHVPIQIQTPQVGLVVSPQQL
jgi:Predicted metal binding domain